jgi:hypothetical protein
LVSIEPELSIINIILGLAAEIPTYKGFCAGSISALAELNKVQIRSPQTIMRW